MITAAQLAQISIGGAIASNCVSIVTALDRYGAKVGLDQPQRLCHFLARLGVESGGFHYDHEIWGPTPAQKRYDTRTDLGNTAAADGDGYKYRGRGPIQITGKVNYGGFTVWARDLDPAAPSFVEQPDAVLTDPWEGLSPIWYWSTRKNAGKSLNDYADANDLEMVCRIINGGLNGLADQMTYYVRTGLVLLGYTPTAVVAFQGAHGLKPDGIAGPATRTAIHGALKSMYGVPAIPAVEVAANSACSTCGKRLAA